MRDHGNDLLTKIIRKKWRNVGEIPTPEIIELHQRTPDFLLLMSARRHEAWENTEDNLDKIRKTVFSHKFITFTHSQKNLWWKICSPPRLCLKWCGKWSWANWKLQNPHSPRSESRINWRKRGPKWDLAQEVKYSNLFFFLPCSVSWSVFLFPRGNHSPVSSPDCLGEDDTDLCYTAELGSHHHTQLCTDVWIMLGLLSCDWTWEIELGMRHLADNTEQKYIHQSINGIHLSRSKTYV